MRLDANACRGIVTFGIGVSCFVVGTATTATLAPSAAVVAGTLAGGMLVGIGPNMVSTVGHDALNATWIAVSERLQAASRRGRLPENHDFARALRRAQLLGLRHCVELCRVDVRRQPQEFDVKAMQVFHRRAERWIKDALAAAHAPDFFLDAPAEEPIRDAMMLLTNSAPAVEVAATFQRLDGVARAALLEELAVATSCEIPDAFIAWFHGGGDFAPGWQGAAFAFFAEQLKTDERLRTVVFLERMNLVLAGQAGAERKLLSGIETILSRAGNLDHKLDAVANSVAELSKRLEQLAQPSPVPLHIPSVSISSRTSLSFASRSTPFVGRAAEMDELARFLQAPDAFLWLSVSGPAGSGKSRLLLEALLSAGPEWSGGFVDFLRPGFDWAGWHRPKNVLLVLDYATAYAEQAKTIFASLQATAKAGCRVRIVAADRCSRDALESRLFTGGDLNRFLPFSFDTWLDLRPLDPPDLQSIALALSEPGDDGDPVELPALPADSSFPLFAALAALAGTEGGFPASLDRLSIVRNWFDREKARYWTPAGVTKSEARLTCLATISGRWSADSALSGKLANCGIDAADVDTGRMEAISGVRPIDWFHPLTPDILGEYFVLQILMEQNPSSSISEATLQVAWEHNPEQTADFIKRAAQDFPEHPVVVRVAGVLPADVPNEAPPPFLGRPALPTMWAEIVADLPLWTMFHHSRAPTLNIVRDACRIEPDHERLAELRTLFGDQMFDDPLCLSDLVLLYSRAEDEVDFEEARNLALRLSDLRWRTTRLVSGMLQQLSGFAEDELTIILDAAETLIRSGRKDRRVRRDISGSLLDALVDRFEAGDVGRAETVWKIFDRLVDWWEKDLERRARPRSDEWRGSEEIPAWRTRAHECFDDSAHHLQHLERTYLAFSAGEDLTDDTFIDHFGKACSNFVMLSLGAEGAPERRVRSELILARLRDLCEDLQGCHDLPGRIVEVYCILIRFDIRAGLKESADELCKQADAIIHRYAAQGVAVAPGEPFLLASIVDVFAEVNEMEAAREAFAALAKRFTLPDEVMNSDRRAVTNCIFNLATKWLERGARVEARSLISVLDEFDTQGADPHAPVLDLRIGIRTNAVVLGWQSGCYDDCAALLSELAPLAGRATSRMGAEYAMAAARVPLLGGQPVPLEVCRGAADVMVQLLTAPEATADAELAISLLRQTQGMLPGVARSDPASATRMVAAASDVALARFRDAATYIDALRHAIEDR